MDVHSNVKTSSEVTSFFPSRDRIQYEKVKHNKCAHLPDSGGVLDWGSQFTIPIPLSFEGPSSDTLWACAPLYISLHVHMMPNVPSILLWLASQVLAPADGRTESSHCALRTPEWWAPITVVAIPSQPALLTGPCISADKTSVISPRASRTILHSRHPADFILPILVRWLDVGVNHSTAIPKRLLRFHEIGLSLKCFPSINFHPVSAWSSLPMCHRKAGRCLPLFASPWYKSFWNSPHPSMYHAAGPLPYSGHSLHRLVVFICS